MDTIEILNYIKKLEKDNKILKTAFLEACRYIRLYPPTEMPEGEYSEIIPCLVGGLDDSEGKKYQYYFLKKALEELTK